MLNQLSVQNLVIVRSAEVEPGKGLTVISGETGAGKTLILEAMKLIMGARASAGQIGPDRPDASVTAVFHPTAHVNDYLENHLGISASDTLILRRKISSNGKSRAWINDVPVSVGSLKNTACLMVDLTSQNEHLKLSSPTYQLDMLDQYGVAIQLRDQYRDIHNQCRMLHAELTELEQNESGSLKELDYLTFLMEEFKGVDMKEGALEKLTNEHTLLSQALEWKEAAQEASDVLNEKDGSVTEILGDLQRRLSRAPDAELANAGTCCAQALESIREASYICSDASVRIDSDPERFEALEEELSRWHQLIRKHGGTEQSVRNAFADISEQIDNLRNLGPKRKKLLAELKQAQKEQDRLGRNLMEARKKAFQKLSRRLKKELADLGLPRVSFKLESRKLNKAGSSGTFHQELLISTNPGIDPGPIKDVPSGGELSRIILAISVVLAEKETTPVLIFDEVDSGVGGRLGKTIGAKLRELAADRTVIAVTHTPQIAALADNQYMVEKVHEPNATGVAVRRLDDRDRIVEITDMLGGGKSAENQARELLETV